MPNRNYEKGRRKEWKLVKKLKSESYIAVRSAGSHSPFDIVAIHPTKKILLLIQSKAGKALSQKEVERLMQENRKLNGLYFCRFVVDNGKD